MGFESPQRRRKEEAEEQEGNREVIPREEPARKETPSNVIEGPWPKREPEPMPEKVPEGPELPESTPEEKVAEVEGVQQGIVESSRGAETKEAKPEPEQQEEEEKERHRSFETYQEFKPCEVCKGKGRRWFFFKCPVCGGAGAVVTYSTSRERFYEMPKENPASSPAQENVQKGADAEKRKG